MAQNDPILDPLFVESFNAELEQMNSSARIGKRPGIAVGNEDGQPKRYQGQTAAYCACTWLR